MAHTHISHYALDLGILQSPRSWTSCNLQFFYFRNTTNQPRLALCLKEQHMEGQDLSWPWSVNKTLTEALFFIAWSTQPRAIMVLFKYFEVISAGSSTFIEHWDKGESSLPPVLQTKNQLCRLPAFISPPSSWTEPCPAAIKGNGKQSFGYYVCHQ